VKAAVMRAFIARLEIGNVSIDAPGLRVIEARYGDAARKAIMWQG
jgi:hypothetical protein